MFLSPDNQERVIARPKNPPERVMNSPEVTQLFYNQVIFHRYDTNNAFSNLSCL